MSYDRISNWKIIKYGRYTDKGWEITHEAVGPISLILQPKMSVLVVQNATLLESVLLSSDPGNVKIIVDRNVVMFVVNDGTTTRKFKVLFDQNKSGEARHQPVQNCVDALRIYFPVSYLSTEGFTAPTEVTTLTEILQNVMTSKDLKVVQRVNTSPTGLALHKIVQLCLLDPTFPSLVDSVDKSLKSLTNRGEPLAQDSFQE